MDGEEYAMRGRAITLVDLNKPLEYCSSQKLESEKRCFVSMSVSFISIARRKNLLISTSILDKE
jgi:hypothetical protein